MTSASILAICNSVLSVAIMALCFYRTHKTDRLTYAKIRWSYSGLGAAAFWMLIAPPEWRTSASICLEGAIAIVLLAATPQWVSGPPPSAQHTSADQR